MEQTNAYLFGWLIQLSLLFVKWRDRQKSLVQQQQHNNGRCMVIKFIGFQWMWNMNCGCDLEWSPSAKKNWLLACFPFDTFGENHEILFWRHNKISTQNISPVAMKAAAIEMSDEFECVWKSKCYYNFIDYFHLHFVWTTFISVFDFQFRFFILFFIANRNGIEFHSYVLCGRRRELKKCANSTYSSIRKKVIHMRYWDMYANTSLTQIIICLMDVRMASSSAYHHSK